jgi:hypothetical protein
MYWKLRLITGQVKLVFSDKTCSFIFAKRLWSNYQYFLLSNVNIYIFNMYIFNNLALTFTFTYVLPFNFPVVSILHYTGKKHLNNLSISLEITK